MIGFFVHWMRWVLLASLVISPGFSGGQVQKMSPLEITYPTPNIVLAEYHDQSLPLRDMKDSLAPQALTLPDPQFHHLPRSGSGSQTIGDPIAPYEATDSMPASDNQWDGIKNYDNPSYITPPDTNGDVGPNHYVQWVNLSLAVYDKSGQLKLGPIPGNFLWSGFGAPCQTSNHGDPIVLYDSLADRWFASQFVIPTGGSYYQCIAVSASPDPTGAWYRYAFKWSDSKMNDYPKFGVWPDGYYMTVNQFIGNSWAGGGVAVFERDAMLQNLPAHMISFDLYEVDNRFGGMLPADLDGREPPPAGAPNVFAEWDDSSIFGAGDALRLWDFHVDWKTPALSTFGVNFQPNLVLPTIDVDPDYANTYRIPQKGTSAKLDAISDRLMYRLQYRNFGDHQTLVSNHTVNATSTNTGIHWFELRKTASTDWYLAQEGLHAPNANSRWMGSIAMDNSGNIALGYSVSGPELYPSIAYAGRLASDPAGVMAQDEVTMISGTGSQTSVYSRWGDYSMMAVDPADECTFWYTQEYYVATSSIFWNTRIGAFKFPSCNQADTGILQGTVRAAYGLTPIAGARVNAGGAVAFTGVDGTFRMLLPVGQVDVQVSAFSYQSQTLPALIVKDGTTQLDFSLVKAALAVVSGTVSDGSAHLGMPLFARIDIPGVPESPIFTDPLTGQYQISLEQGSTYTFNVSAVNGGYLAENRTVIPGATGNIEDFALLVDSAPCPPGYQTVVNLCQPESGGLVVGYVKDANNPPHPVSIALPGATITDIGSGAAVNAGSDPAGLFFLFAPAGHRSISASYPVYTSLTVQVQVSFDQVVGANFNLPAGYMQATPGEVNLTVSKWAPTADMQINFTNQGTAPALFALSEMSGTPPDNLPTGPFASAGRRLSPKSLNALTANKVYEFIPPAAPAWPGGGTPILTWDTGLAAPWGLGLRQGAELWVSDALSGGGDGQDHPFNLQGEAGSGSISTGWGGAFAADMAYDPLRDRLWQVNAGGDNCLYELDPEQQKATGVRICPPFGNSQRGLAYDPFSQTFYSGTWNDAILTHFDRTGTILDSVNTGINIAGLAYHPDSGHLYVLSNAAVGFDVYVLDARHAYTILGGFDVPGLTDFGQAGMEFAQDGSLWLVDTLGRRVFKVTSGETAFSPMEDVPWLSESLTGANIPVGGSLLVTVSVDASGLHPGFYQAYITVTTDTPYDMTPYKVGPIAVNLTITPVPIYLPFVGRFSDFLPD